MIYTYGTISFYYIRLGTIISFMSYFSSRILTIQVIVIHFISTIFKRIYKYFFKLYFFISIYSFDNAMIRS